MKTKFFIFIIIIVIIGTAAYFLFFNKPKPKLEEVVDTKGAPIQFADDSFPLKLHSSGMRVKQLQAGLNLIKKSNLALDGKFGNLTLAALQEGFAITSLSEANYNTYILPNIEEINNLITKAHPSNTTTTAKPAPIISFFGKSVSATKAVTGFVALKESDIYTIDTSKPLKYTAGQYVGVVEADSNGWLRCMRTNGSRVLILKNSVEL